MITPYRFLLSLGFSCIISFQGFAEGSIADDSEKFALLDEQQAGYDQPVARDLPIENEDEVALARDDDEIRNDNLKLLDKLRGELQELRGQLEAQAEQLQSLQQQQLAFYKDLDSRLPNELRDEKKSFPTPKDAHASAAKPKAENMGLEKKDPDSSKINLVNHADPVSEEKKQLPDLSKAVENTARGNPADEQISYLAAYDLVKNKRFNDALSTMQTFVDQYPQGGYAANAHYWLGELYLVKNEYLKAIQHFEIVLKQFPSSTKAAASTLKIGYALAASGQMEAAKQRLQQVLKNYPDTPTAQLALAKLDSLGLS